MYGLPSRKTLNFRNGGPISGPGTGISDDIPATVPEGSFIMPADSTQQIGLGLNPEVIRRYRERQAAAAEPTRLGFGPGSELEKRMVARQAESSPGQGLRPRDVPVNLSNGEHALSPEQVHAVGAQVLNAVKGITHVPAEMQARGLRAPEAAGISDAEPLRIGFANGGAVPPARTGFGLNPERMRAHKEAQEANVTRLGLRRFLADGGQVKAQERGLGLPGYKPSAPAAPAQTGFGLNAEVMRKLATPPEPTRFGLNKERWRDLQSSRPGMGLGIGPGSAGERMKAARQSFADGGQVEDEERPSWTGMTYGQMTSREPRLPQPPRSAEPTIPEAVTRRFGELQSPGMRLRVQGQDLAESGREMGATDAYPDETRRNAALLLTHKPNTIKHQEFNAADLTMQQRNDAGDEYRKAWQRMTGPVRDRAGNVVQPGGLQRANSQALDLYNAEQQVRGTGITARRGANGVMEFSGDGSNALPQNYTQGVDLNLANERMARANAIRQSQLDAGGGGVRAAAIGGDSMGPSAYEQERAAWSRDVDRFSMAGKSGGRAGRAQQALDQRAIEIIMGDARTTADRNQRAQEAAQRLGLDQQRLTTDADQARQRLGLDAQGVGIDQQRLGMAQAEHTGKMTDAEFVRQARQGLLDTAGSTDQAAISRARAQAIAAGILKPESDAEQKVIYNEEALDPGNAMAGTRRVPMVLNRDGTATVVQPRTAPRGLPQGVSRDAAIQSARRAIEMGYDRDAVMARLGEFGLSFGDLK